MKSHRLWMVFTFLAAVLIWSQWFFLAKALQSQEQLGLRRLQKAMTHLVERACLSQDDLLVQQIMKALSDTPGLSQAALLDSQQTVLAHTDPSKLGTRLHLSARKINQTRARSPITLSPSSVPGQFLMVYSSQPRRRWLRREAFLLSGITFVVGILLCWQGWQFARSRQTQDKRIRDLDEHLSDLQGRLKTAQTQAQHLTATWQHYLSSAVGRIQAPLLLLDDHQRLIAWNPAAQKRLAHGSTLVQRRSWHEFPCLANVGAPLEKSLQSPGQVFDAPSGESGQVQLETFHLNEEAGTGTWVTFR